MADGYAHFQQAGQYYPSFSQQRLRRTPPQTPSPSRSPAPQSPGSYFYSPNQTHHNAMMNQTHRNFLPQQQNMAKFFPQLHQNSQQLDQLGHVAHAGNNALGNHQHTFSGGLTNQSYGSPQPTTANGTTNAQSNSPHWQEQQNLLNTSRNSAEPHHHARQAAILNKNSSALVSVSGGVNPNSYHPTNGQHRKDGPPAEDLERRNEAGEMERQDWKALDLGGQGLHALSEHLFAYTFLDKLYINHNKLTRLPAAIGKLKLLQLLDASSNQLTELPAEIGMLTNLKQLLLFDNQLTTLPYELGSLYQLDVLGIEGNPLQDELKQIMIKEGTRSLIVTLRDTPPGFALMPPGDRDWIVIDENLSDDPKVAADRFQVMNYNILCNKMATQSLYGYVPSWALQWEYRRAIIKEQLLESRADIICLQEVDLENFNDFFIPELGSAGYRGQIQPKSRANTMTEAERKVVDGCATFYNSEKFALLDTHTIEFASSSLKHDKLEKTEDIFNRVMPKDNVALILCLENKITGSRVIVANVHVTWAPEFNDVKLVQVAMLMEDLTKVAKKWTSPPQNRDAVYDNTPPPPVYTDTTQIPVIIGGDFNSLADSGVYELLSRGTIANDHDDLSTRDYGNLTRDGIKHPFSLKSAYTNVGELQFTNYTPGFTGVIDYIWYTTGTLNVTGLLGDIDKKYLDTVAGFPNAHFPSDHIPLQAEFQIKPRKEIMNKPPPPDFGNSGGSSRR